MMSLSFLCSQLCHLEILIFFLYKVYMYFLLIWMARNFNKTLSRGSGNYILIMCLISLHH